MDDLRGYRRSQKDSWQQVVGTLLEVRGCLGEPRWPTIAVTNHLERHWNLLSQMETNAYALFPNTSLCLLHYHIRKPHLRGRSPPARYVLPRPLIPTHLISKPRADPV
jgi:hypothetical protein